MVSPEYVFLAEGDFGLTGGVHIAEKADDDGKAKLEVFASYPKLIFGLDGFGLTEEHHAQRTPGVAHIDGLIAVVEHKDANGFDHLILPWVKPRPGKEGTPSNQSYHLN
jgi:hypothetical protein